MKDFTDRQPTKPGRRKIIYPDGREEFVTVIMADNPIREGTPLNREAFMAVQGYETILTEFRSDGSIVETNANGETQETVFNTDGTITETFTNTEDMRITKITYFREDGSIFATLGDVEPTATMGVKNYHDKLLHRDYADQHPIDAIDGLDEELDRRLDKNDNIGKEFISNLFQGLREENK